MESKADYHHTISCAILSTSHGLLDAGLRTILRDGALRANQTSRTMSSRSLCLLCSQILSSQSSSIIESIERMLTKYKCVDGNRQHFNISHELRCQVSGSIFEVKTASKSASDLEPGGKVT